MAPRQLVLVVGVVTWGALMFLDLITGNQMFLGAAVLVIIAQVVAGVVLRRQ